MSYFSEKQFEKLENILSYNKVLVFNLGFDRKSKYTKEHWFYVPDKAVNFYRIGFYDISELVARAMELPSTENPALREILAADKAARELVWAACGK